MPEMQFDEIGNWSEIKLEIIKKYASAYSTILSHQKNLKHVYIDGFAGAGAHWSKTTREFVPGSPLNALLIDPPFAEYHWIDLNKNKAGLLRGLAANRLDKDVFVYEGDCNEVLLKSVLPRVRYEDYRRGLCVLDPYGLHLDWEVMAAIGKMKSIEIFLNFPVMDMNMNVLQHRPEKVRDDQAARMTRFWGDESWRQAAYQKQENLFGFDEIKNTNDDVAQAFRERLKKVGGFANVIEPLPMRNNQGSIVYYLFFASPNDKGNKIANEVFDKFRK